MGSIFREERTRTAVEFARPDQASKNSCSFLQHHLLPALRQALGLGDEGALTPGSTPGSRI